MERRSVAARVQRLCQRDAGERLAGGKRLARPKRRAVVQREAEDEGTGVLRRVFEAHGLRGLARREVKLLIARYGDVLAAAGVGLREPLHPVAARAAGGQQERKGKGKKGRKDIRFSVHRLTTFLFLAPSEPHTAARQGKDRLNNCATVLRKSCLGRSDR